MEVLDPNGKQMCSGLRVTYIGTHTTENVANILIKEGTAWVKLDSNGISYKSDYTGIMEE